MNQTRINELKAMLDFAGRQSKTKAQLKAPDGSVDKNEIEALADVMKEILDELVPKSVGTVATPAPVATPEIKKT